jgi:hypothetical protein
MDREKNRSRRRRGLDVFFCCQTSAAPAFTMASSVSLSLSLSFSLLRCGVCSETNVPRLPWLQLSIVFTVRVFNTHSLGGGKVEVVDLGPSHTLFSVLWKETSGEEHCARDQTLYKGIRRRLTGGPHAPAMFDEGLHGIYSIREADPVVSGGCDRTPS